ncbi:MAG: tetratricopeptide repeat protein [Bacteroidales bacterium]|nr:tetratricopeptide repeat protein [Bacteroidales bacterium]
MKRFILIILAIGIFQQSYCQKKSFDYLKARSHMEMENYDSALYYFNRLINKVPKNFTAIYERGMVHYYLNMFPSADKDFRLVNQRYKERASLMLAKTELRLNHPEIAIKYLREHLESSYRIPEKDLLLDPELSSLEGTSLWNELWREKEWYLPVEVEIQEARYMMNSGNHLEALNILQKLEKQGLKRSQIYQCKAEIYLLTGNVKAAESELTKSVKANYRNLEAVKMRASLYYESGDYEDALADCENILRQDPASFDLLILSAKTKSKLEDHEGALKNITLYRAMFPNDDKGFYEEGNIYFAQGKYLKAIPCFNHALDLNKGEATYYYARGLSYAASNTHKYAVKDFSMSLDLDPLSAEAWYAKGLTEIELGDMEAACFAFRRATQYGIVKARAQVEKLCK